MQKVIEQFPPDNKPQFLFVGHLHITNHLPSYRNVAGFQVPCFQTQTQYLREKGLNPEIGFIILEITTGGKGNIHYKTDWHIFYDYVGGDY
jgi:DNA polymerase II small subunit/DNA polymerase delta subunit B